MTILLMQIGGLVLRNGCRIPDDETPDITDRNRLNNELTNLGCCFLEFRLTIPYCILEIDIWAYGLEDRHRSL